MTHQRGEAVSIKVYYLDTEHLETGETFEQLNNKDGVSLLGEGHLDGQSLNTVHHCAELYDPSLEYAENDRIQKSEPFQSHMIRNDQSCD